MRGLLRHARQEPRLKVLVPEPPFALHSFALAGAGALSRLEDVEEPGSEAG